MNYLTRSTSICSRAISCLASMRKPTATNGPAFSFLLFQTCNMGTKAMLKTNKAAAKRVRIRGSGSVKRNKQGFSHNTGYLTRKRSNNLGKTTGIQGTAIEKRIRVLVGH
mmetsp:Transcript_681/g.1069  ORF Transcript_681/g.1069 Transcript_681/m.1069 type:complete len:110 (+) Transcript_681:78-407(+)